MNADGKSDESMVPSNPANNGEAESPAESAEGRLSANRNTDPSNLARTPSRKKRRSNGLLGVREAARGSRDLKFTALLHHISEELLTSSFYELKKNAAVGVDEVTWHEYEGDLEDRIADLHGRIHRGGFRAKPSRRVYISKSDGRQRPLGIASLEDKIVQHAVRVVLQCIYLWINQWRTRHCKGQCIVVRYADDFVIGFETEMDAKACLDALKERLQEFGLKLHPKKTRLIEFGRASAARRQREGRGRCETFDFLGFTHICGKTRKNKRFVLWRRTNAKRISRTLAAIKDQLRRRRHDPVGKTGRWLKSVIRGWLQYHAIPDNMRRLEQFVSEVTKLWLRQLRRRSQRGRAAWPWSRMNRLVTRYLPQPKILHPYPKDRFRARLAARAV